MQEPLIRLNLRKPLPNKDGLSPSAVWLRSGTWKTVIEFLNEQFPDIPTQLWVKRMAAGEVVNQHGSPFAPDHAYVAEQHLFYYRHLEGETIIPFEEQILFENEHIVVADKPHFLPTMPAGRFLYHTLLVRLQQRLDLEHLVPIHRLDRETAGVIVFSKIPATRGSYQQLFANGNVKKFYEALAAPLSHLDFPYKLSLNIVKGRPFFRMTTGKGTPNSHTTISVLARNLGSREHQWLYKLEPKTGKKHQLRVHLSHLGAPIINDPFYPELQEDKGDDFTAPLKLLARSLSFRDPITKEEHTFTSKRSLL